MTRTDGVAVVTGAGSGIGRATALALAGRGLRVHCVGRRQEPLARTAELIGDRASVVPADVGTEEGIATVADAVGESAVSALVHAAAIEGIHSLAATTRAIFDALISVNLGGPFFLTRALAPRFDDGAGVVFVGSVSARHGRERHAAYSAGKAALLGLTSSLAVELGPRVRVNCVSPGATDTPMFAEAVQDYFGGLEDGVAETVVVAERSRLLLDRIADPAEVATAIVYLALDATFSTGSVLDVDGGYSAR
ncbi:SDR family NAD(P)-dependent oxidoreductase [Amycolatopsis pigmentata]|uniref:SDR family NAD(P)-dependent oxidoreductase n=1 Tax=Amycolatopsis pigmentata TaxID=450801 RepID=A0ABW5FN68_9PSEU